MHLTLIWVSDPNTILFMITLLFKWKKGFLFAAITHYWYYSSQEVYEYLEDSNEDGTIEMKSDDRTGGTLDMSPELIP